MRIADREIGPNEPVYVIAEVGVNHDGDPERTLALTDAAAEAGADAVKLQIFRTDLLMSRDARLAMYQNAAGETDPVAMLRRLELDLDALGAVVERAHAVGLHAIATVFSVELVDEAEGLGLDAFKTASPDIVHRPLLERLAATGLPMVVSTGASELEEIERARAWLDGVADRLAFLHCVSSYPTPEEAAHLSMIGSVGAAVEPCPVGFSDHTTQETTGAAAVQAGARILEKHLTDDRSRPGPDHAASLEPQQFAEYARMAREPYDVRVRVLHEPMLGERRKRVLEIERDVRTVSRQSLVTTRDLPAGHTLEFGDLTFKRPGTGFEPWRLEEVLGRRLAHPIEADRVLHPAALEH